MYQRLEMAPPDPILGISAAFQRDPRADKVNLSVGVYQDAAGKTPVLRTVKKVEERILAAETTKSYKPIEGAADYATRVEELVFGRGHEALASRRVATAHTPGGTGALRVAASFLHEISPGSAVWVSVPTWANHHGVFKSAGLEVKEYRYFDAAGNRLDLDAMLADLSRAAAGDVLLLHGCCHNPSGVDPSPEQWKRIADLAGERGLVPLVDLAYQGLGSGLDEDAAGVRELCRPGKELFVCSSFSKNFGLYNERVGALSLVAPSSAQAEIALSHLRLVIRTNYSNPPAHGGNIVAAILADAGLRAEWEGEVADMRRRIQRMRDLFVETLRQQGVRRDFSFLARQKGMFSFSGLTKSQVDALRERHAVYVIGNGRINVAGMTEATIPRVAAAIADVLAEGNPSRS